MFLARAAFAKAATYSPHRAYATPGKKLFKRVLIANRGEITCRVIRTCRRLGIETVAVYTEPDADALFVRTADKAVPLGAEPRAYLDIDKVVNAVLASGADAVHPGYGFLSENPRFVARLEQAGVSFVGPSSKSIAALGDKISAKTLAQKNGVSTVPGVAKSVESMAELTALAQKIGYPVMIKAASGGGGKGMRVARNDSELAEGYRLSRQEAANAFGDDRVLLEKFVENPHHIEIQVMGDGRGGAIYFPERECSIQRRNQKVVEEAPSPHLDAATRRRMGEQACRLAAAVQYRTAGTCEFLVDEARNFYFLEMNTRLQVEHPITEMITGVDLVELMLRVAAGEPLPLKQEDVKIRGWAMEARVYAEDPLRGFLPSIGQLTTYREPSLEGGHVRIDTGVVEGSAISTYYDPLIAKLAAWGETRGESIVRTARALDSYVIGGLTHNVNFLRDVMQNKRFLDGHLSTSFIPQEYPEGFKGHVLSAPEAQQLFASAAMVRFARDRHAQQISGQLLPAPLPTSAEYTVQLDKRSSRVAVSETAKGTFEVRFDGGAAQTLRCDWRVGEAVMRASLGDASFVIQPVGVSHGGTRLTMQHIGTKYQVTVLSPEQAELNRFMRPEVRPDTSNSVTSPMPGKVISIATKPGDTVFAGQELAVVEAMKMQNVLRAPRDAVVARVAVQPGQDVALDQLLIEFAPRAPAAGAEAAAARPLA